MLVSALVVYSTLIKTRNLYMVSEVESLHMLIPVKTTDPERS